MDQNKIEVHKNNQLKDETTSFFNLVWLFGKRLFSSSSTLYFLAIPIVGILSVGLIFPIFLSMNFIMCFSLTGSSFFIYGLFFFNLRKSTIYNSILLKLNNKKGKANIYGSILFLIMVFNILFSLIILYIMLILNHFVIGPNFPYPLGRPIQNGYSTIKGYDLINFSSSFGSVHYGVFFYYVILTTIVSFAMSLVFQGVTSSFKGYIIISITYILLLIIFGSVIQTMFMPSFTGEYVFNERTGILTNETYFVIDSENVKSWSYDSLNDKWNLELFVQPTKVDKVGSVWTYSVKTFDDVKGNTIWWISQLFPQNFLNSIFYYSLLGMSYSNLNPDFSDNITELYFGSKEASYLIKDLSISFDFFSFNNSLYVYNFVMIYVWLVIWIIAGGIINNEI